MARTRKTSPRPLPVRKALRKLGQDLHDARRRRRIPAELLAERASISRSTLHKIEQGDAGVAMGNYANVLFALGLIDGLAGVADVTADTIGLELEDEHLPQRVRRPRKPSSKANRPKDEKS